MRLWPLIMGDLKMNRVTIGQVVSIKPEWQDEGDDHLIWMALDNATAADIRCRILPLNTGLKMPPIMVVNIDWLED